MSLEHGDEGPFGSDIDRADRHAVDILRSVPPGATIRVVVGARIYPTSDAVRMLRWAKTVAHVVVMASTLEAGLAWQHAIDDRAAS